MTVAALVLAVFFLTVHNLGVERLRPALYVPACLTTTAVVVGLARLGGIDPGDLGVSVAGIGVGLAVAGGTLLAVVAAGLARPTRRLFADRRMAGVAPRRTAYQALVRIPLGTVLVEEVAFRGVLLALGDRLLPLGWAVAGSSALFGLWHVVPVRSTLATNHVRATPALLGATIVGLGMVGGALCWLRLFTGGLLAPAMVHASASASATVVGSVVQRRSPPLVNGGRVARWFRSGSS
ncbi:MAG: protease family protein [Actinomycetota bacterium]|nr:protease family protein [Actinomycetota bacterium]